MHLKYIVLQIYKIKYRVITDQYYLLKQFSHLYLHFAKVKI